MARYCVHSKADRIKRYFLFWAIRFISFLVDAYSTTSEAGFMIGRRIMFIRPASPPSASVNTPI